MEDGAVHLEQLAAEGGVRGGPGGGAAHQVVQLPREAGKVQPRQLAGDNALQTESGGGNPFKTIHLFPPETIDRFF